MRRRRNGYRILVILAAASAAWAAAGPGGLPALAAPAAGQPLAQVAPAPPWTARASVLGPAPPGRRQTVTVYLRQPHAAAAAHFAAAVSDPRSALYRHFLTPARYRSRFAPPPGSAGTVRGYLRGQGLRVQPGPANRLYVRATGTVRQLQRAFHTTLRSYRAGAVPAVAPAGPLRMPSGVARVVAGVTGLDTRVAGQARAGRMGPPAVPSATGLAGPAFPGATGLARPAPRRGAHAQGSPVVCSQYAFQHTAALPAAYGRTVFPTLGCGYTPAQLHTAYGTAGLLAHGVTGRGVKVAVFLFFPVPTAAADLDRFAAGHGLPQLAPGQFTQVLPGSFNVGPSGGCPPVQNVTNEAEGDLESVHEMAPGAGLVYVAAPDCLPQDLLATLNQTVDQRLADVVTNSWGLLFSQVPAAVREAAHQDYVQAAAEGMSFFYASGDLGDYSTVLGGATDATWPAADPAVTAVGGTSLFAGRQGNRESEIGWGTTIDPVVSGDAGAAYGLPLPGQYVLGSGGGPAAGYAQPAYQRAVVPSWLAGSSDPRRVVPDVAADADLATPVLFGVTVGGTYTEGGGGGTSVSSPLFAGLQALTDQVAGGPSGFLNPALYLLHGTPVFHDIRAVPRPVAAAFLFQGATYLDTMQGDTSLVARPGYDDQTGLGSPDGAAYAAALALFHRAGFHRAGG